MTAQQRLQVTGHYAGAVSRGAAALLDVGIVFGTFTLGVAGFNLLSKVFFGSTGDGQTGLVWVVALASWAFLYVFVSHAVAGRTTGKGIVGLRVVSSEGAPLSVGSSLARTIALPLSVVPMGLGLVGIIFHKEHRALHDLIAKTAVVYDWGTREAELPAPLSAFISRQAGSQYAPAPKDR